MGEHIQTFKLIVKHGFRRHTFIGSTSSSPSSSLHFTCAVLLKRSSFEENPALNFLWWPSNWV